MVTYSHSLTLPWTIADADEKRFRRIVKIIMAVTLVLSIIVPLLPVIKKSVDQEAELPTRIAKLIIEKREKAKPIPTPVEKPKPEPEPVAKEEPIKKEKPEIKPAIEKPAAVIKPAPTKPIIDTKKLAREKAKKSGLLAMSDALADLRTQSTVDQLKNATQLTKSGTSAKKAERSLISAKTSSNSKGIDTRTLSRDTGSTQLANRATTEVESPVDFGITDSATQDGSRRTGGRSDEEIQYVFDSNKSAIYSLYNRELRKDPSLQGKMVIRLTIDPSGSVTHIELISSELESPKLEAKLMQRVKMFNFGEKAVDAVTVTYPIQFLPA